MITPSMRSAIDVRYGDCRDVLATLKALDACVTDPPYHLTTDKRGGAGEASLNLAHPAGRSRITTGGFMGKQWDGGDVAFRVETWRLVFDALKPGAHLVAFGGTRTWHRLAVAIEDAGFEIRDSVLWLYGQGFPKSHAVPHVSLIATRQEFDGWGTALKPAHEPIILARKPLIGSVAANVLTHGTGGINIDACRIEASDAAAYAANCSGDRGHADNRSRDMDFAMGCGHSHPDGRWPANVVHDGSPEVMDAFAAYGESKSVGGYRGAGKRDRGYGMAADADKRPIGFGDTGTAARFFYCAKASKADRAGSKHPTVKPVALMRWLVRLVCPPGGTVLDPFAGSGTTGEAAMLEGMNAVLIEREAEYADDIRRRTARWSGTDRPLLAEAAD